MSNEKKECNEGGAKIDVLVGYGWQKFFGSDVERKGADVAYDTFWKSLSGIFTGSCKGFEKSTGVNVTLRRLRATHGRLLWPTIEKRIRDADILIFDVAAAPEKSLPMKGAHNLESFVTGLNANVLLEIGYALGCGKRVILMCPKHLCEKIPSDLKGFFWTFYRGTIKDGSVTRTLDDVPGAINAFRGALREMLSEKTGVDSEE